MTPYGDMDLVQHELRWWLVAWRHQAITRTNFGFSLMRLCGIHLRAILQHVPWLSFCIMSLKFLLLTHCGLVMPYGDRSGSKLAQVMACCLTAPSHYLNQCWLIISKVQWHSYQGNFTRDASTVGQWLKSVWKLHIYNFLQISQEPMS